jgi:hypothetical protein
VCDLSKVAIRGAPPLPTAGFPTRVRLPTHGSVAESVGRTDGRRAGQSWRAARFVTSFHRHSRSIHPMWTVYWQRGRSHLPLRPQAHRLDESATGYSSAGCSPAEPASASPAIVRVNQLAGTVNHHPAGMGDFDSDVWVPSGGDKLATGPPYSSPHFLSGCYVLLRCGFCCTAMEKLCLVQCRFVSGERHINPQILLRRHDYEGSPDARYQVLC